MKVAVVSASDDFSVSRLITVDSTPTYPPHSICLVRVFNKSDADNITDINEMVVSVLIYHLGFAFYFMQCRSRVLIHKMISTRMYNHSIGAYASFSSNRSKRENMIGAHPGGEFLI